MQKSHSIGIGAGAIALTIATAAGVATASSGSATPQATGTHTAVTVVNRHITRAQARRIARAKVPHSRVIEVESDDLHDVPVWKVTLATPHGRVIVDVNKRTGRATIVRRGGSGRDNATVMVTSRADDHGRDARDNDRAGDRMRDVRDNDRADDRGRDVRDNDQGRDGGRHHDGDRHDRGGDGDG